ncbi:hypothetical protein KAI87_04105, partial [Myxococcota bacterium]|nr:hypothetical protein [Myxococcota bacterium]
CNADETCDSAEQSCTQNAYSMDVCSTADGCCLTPGDLYASCKTGDLCNGDYECVADICVEVGGKDQPCYSNLSCDEAGYGCSSSNSEGLCSAPESLGCCLEEGVLHGLCLSGDTCTSTGLVCTEGLCLDPIRGAEDQSCNADNSCDDSALGCFDDNEGPCGAGIDECCLSAGAVDERCFSDNSCSGDFECVYSSEIVACAPLGLDRCCQDTGALNQPCHLDNTCDSGLNCVSGGVCDGFGFQDCCQPAG